MLDITAEQHAHIDRLRHDVALLLPYLREQQIFTTINHVASQVNGRLTARLTLVGAAAHFIEEARFNRSLLFDLVARPALAPDVDSDLFEAA